MGRHPSRRHVTPDEAPIGRRIRRRRRELGITQAELAGPDYTKSFISQLESGYADPSLDTLRFLGRRLHLSLSGMAGDTVDQRVAVLDGLLAWAHERREAGDLEGAQRALDMVRHLAPPADPATGDGAPHLVEAHLLVAEMALDEGRADGAGRAVEAIREITVGPHLQCWRAIIEGRVALRREDAATALARFKAATRHTRNATRYPALAVRAAVGVAAVSAHRGALRHAQRRLNAAAAGAARHELGEMHGRVLLRLAWVVHLSGDDTQAVAYAREGSALIASAGHRAGDSESAQVLDRLLAGPDAAAATVWPIDPSI